MLTSLPPRTTDTPEPRPSSGLRVTLLVADSAVTCFLFFAAIAARLLAGDEVIGLWACRAAQAAGFILFLSLALLPADPHRGGWKKNLLANSTAYLAIAVWLPGRLATLVPAKGSSQLWLALEWWKIPSNLWLFLRVAPLASVLLAAAFVAALYLLVARGKPLPLVVGSAVLALLLAWKTATMTSGIRIILYWVVFLTPLGLVAVLANTDRHRLIARFGLLGVGCALVLLFYSAVLPATGSRPLAGESGAHLVYPPKGIDPGIPLEYLREFSLDPASRTLFSSFGPTSGVFRLRLVTGDLDVIETLGVIRTIWADPASSEVLAPDWLDSELFVLRKDPFAVVDRVDIQDDLVFSPLGFQVTPDRVYLLSTDYPGLTEYERPGFRKLRQMPFRALGLTRFRSGAWDCALDRDSKRLFAEIGMVDLSGAYLLLRIDLASFRVDGTARLPDGGSKILFVPEHRAVFAMSFFSDRIYEVDADSLAIRRVLRGPLTTRAAAYDARRDLLYFLGFARGDLWVVRHADGTVLKKAYVGKKALSLALDDRAAKLVVGSAEGIFEIDLAEFLGEKPT